jgi:hypothetical protein
MLLDAQLDGGVARAAAGAARAERTGFAGVWAAEVTRDPMLSLAAAAAATTDVTVGTNVVLAFTRNPMSVAEFAPGFQPMNTFGDGLQVTDFKTARTCWSEEHVTDSAGQLFERSQPTDRACAHSRPRMSPRYFGISSCDDAFSAWTSFTNTTHTFRSFQRLSRISRSIKPLTMCLRRSLPWECRRRAGCSSRPSWERRTWRLS